LATTKGTVPPKPARTRASASDTHDAPEARRRIQRSIRSTRGACQRASARRAADPALSPIRRQICESTLWKSTQACGERATIAGATC
jgi:hypothetical protein